MSPFTSQADFTFSSGEQSVSGSLLITHADYLAVDITAPEELSGICAQSNNTENASTYSIGYSGIRSTVPKSILGKIDLTFMLFSPSVASEIASINKDVPKQSVGEFKLQGLSEIIPYNVSFSKNDVDFDLTYDKQTGTPLIFCASCKQDSVCLIFKKFKPEN